MNSETPPVIGAALVFVQRGRGSDWEIWQDGKRLNGVRSVVIRADYADATTHEVEFLTGATGGAIRDEQG